MNMENQEPRDDVPADIEQLESEFFRRPRPGRVTEQLLWSYALGALSTEEEDRVHSLMACDDEAQQRLSKIQASIERAARLLSSRPEEETRTSEAARDLAAVAVRQLLAAVGKLGEDIAIALSWVEGALIADLGLSKWKAAYDSVATLGAAEPATAPTGSVLQEFSSKGVKVRLIVVKPPRVNVEIELEEAGEGEVQLFRLGKGPQRHWVGGKPLGRGKILFERCSPGLFEIVLPGGGAFLLAIADADGKILKND